MGIAESPLSGEWRGVITHLLPHSICLKLHSGEANQCFFQSSKCCQLSSALLLEHYLFVRISYSNICIASPFLSLWVSLFCIQSHPLCASGPGFGSDSGSSLQLSPPADNCSHSLVYTGAWGVGFSMLYSFLLCARDSSSKRGFSLTSTYPNPIFWLETGAPLFGRLPLFDKFSAFEGLYLEQCETKDTL